MWICPWLREKDKGINSQTWYRLIQLFLFRIQKDVRLASMLEKWKTFLGKDWYIKVLKTENDLEYLRTEKCQWRWSEYLRNRCGWRGTWESHHEGISLFWLDQALFEEYIRCTVWYSVSSYWYLGIFLISTLIYCTHGFFFNPVRWNSHCHKEWQMKLRIKENIFGL